VPLYCAQLEEINTLAYQAVKMDYISLGDSLTMGHFTWKNNADGTGTLKITLRAHDNLVSSGIMITSQVHANDFPSCNVSGGDNYEDIIGGSALSTATSNQILDNNGYSHAETNFDFQLREDPSKYYHVVGMANTGFSFCTRLYSPIG